MCLPAGDDQLPAAHAAPGDGALPGILLERERDITALGGVDQRLTRHEMQWAGILLVPGESDDDSGAVQSADALERFERVENDDVSTLHVRAARAAASVSRRTNRSPSPSKTVSRCPISSRRFPFVPLCSAKRWPARPTASGRATHVG